MRGRQREKERVSARVPLSRLPPSMNVILNFQVASFAQPPRGAELSELRPADWTESGQWAYVTIILDSGAQTQSSKTQYMLLKMELLITQDLEQLDQTKNKVQLNLLNKTVRIHFFPYLRGLRERNALQDFCHPFWDVGLTLQDKRSSVITH